MDIVFGMGAGKMPLILPIRSFNPMLDKERLAGGKTVPPLPDIFFHVIRMDEPGPFPAQ